MRANIERTERERQQPPKILTLAEWLKRNRKTGSDLAKEIDVDPSTINRLIPKPGKKQTRRPGRRLMPKIKAATKGEVTADSFMTDASTTDPFEANGGEL